MLTSLTETDGLVELPEEVTRLGVGRRGRFRPLQRVDLATALSERGISLLCKQSPVDSDDPYYPSRTNPSLTARAARRESA